MDRDPSVAVAVPLDKALLALKASLSSSDAAKDQEQARHPLATSLKSSRRCLAVKEVQEVRKPLSRPRDRTSSLIWKLNSWTQ